MCVVDQLYGYGWSSNFKATLLCLSRSALVFHPPHTRMCAGCGLCLQVDCWVCVWCVGCGLLFLIQHIMCAYTPFGGCLPCVLLSIYDTLPSLDWCMHPHCVWALQRRGGHIACDFPCSISLLFRHIVLLDINFQSTSVLYPLSDGTSCTHLFIDVELFLFTILMVDRYPHRISCSTDNTSVLCVASHTIFSVGVLWVSVCCSICKVALEHSLCYHSVTCSSLLSVFYLCSPSTLGTRERAQRASGIFDLLICRSI